MARRIVDYLDEIATVLEDPRQRGQVLTGPLGGLWRYRIGRCRVICDVQDRALRVLCCVSEAAARCTGEGPISGVGGRAEIA